MKKILSGVILSTMVASSAFASEGMKVRLGGKIDTQVGVIEQKDQFNRVDSSPTGDRLHTSSLVNNTRIIVEPEYKHNGLKYGAHIEVYADTSTNSDGVPSPMGDKVYSFIESKYGRAELGSVKSASNQMHITAANLARATGGIDGDASDWFAKKTADGKSISQKFTLTPGFPTFCDCKSGANKAVYFSPKYKGFQFGVSYMPDVTMYGTTSKYHSVTRASGADYEHITEGVLKYEGKFNDFTYGLSLAGEKANAKSGSVDRENLEAWEVGGMVGCKYFKVAASYADWGTSGAPVIKNPNAKYGGKQWTVGASYERERFGASVTYLNSKKANLFSGAAPALLSDHDLQANEFNMLSIGFDYKLAEGLMPYAEINFFDMDRKVATSNSGELLLVGTKLKF